MSHISAGHVAPDFTLRTLDGQPASLHTLLARGPVVAAFFKISCPVCQFTFPFIERMYGQQKRSASFIGISQDDAQSTRDFCRTYGVTFPVALDGPGYPVSSVYRLTNVPTIYLIDPDGTIRKDSTGFEKAALEEISRSLAVARSAVPASLFLAHEELPAHRPG